MAERVALYPIELVAYWFLAFNSASLNDGGGDENSNSYVDCIVDVSEFDVGKRNLCAIARKNHAGENGVHRKQDE